MPPLRARQPPDNPDDVRMSFAEHLEELRSRLLRAVVGIVVATAVCIYFGSEILGFLIEPFRAAMVANGLTPEMISIDPTEAFTRYFHTALIFGVGLSAPYALYQLWQFVAAGLYPHERRWVVMFAPASMGLFFAGVLFLVKVILPLTLNFLIWSNTWVPTPTFDDHPRYPTTAAVASAPARLPILRHPPAEPRDGDAWIAATDGTLNVVIAGRVVRFSGTEAASERLVRPIYSIQSYLSFVNGMCLAFGLGFQIPIVVAVLVLLRIVSTAQLRGLRRYTIIGIIVAAAVITPSGDISTQLLLAGPMLLLFEIGVLIGGLIERRRAVASRT